MPFSLTRPSSPTSHPINMEDEPVAGPSRFDLNMPDNNEPRPCLEVHVDKEYLCLKGTGNDVEPARLTGHVALYLAESTPIKEITLHFRGKARLPPAPHETGHLHNSHTYIICNHDWSFLEGEKKHSHTLKAGRHFFPFQLQIGGSLPSSLSTTAFGGASIAYKLRANAVRPGLNSNLQAVIPVHILRSFSSEALEYQQTLEIENTWPDKLMYSIMIPHKAWAATDTLTAQVKFSPLAKGVSVVTVGTSIHETTKINARASVQEYTRIVATVKHELTGGKAVELPSTRYTPNLPSPIIPSAANTPSIASSINSTGSYFSSPPLSPSPPTSPEAGPSSRESIPDPESTSEVGQNDVVAYISLYVPASITPTHSPEPLSISHRLRWSILIANPDGHTSELRCSLPLHLLDKRLLPEARAHTAATRRLLIGGTEVPPQEEEEIELPSYKAHVRDRVANMYLPEAATLRITNPWMTMAAITPPALQTPAIVSRSGHASPLEATFVSHLPHAPGSGDSTPLDWINSELLLSMEPRPSESHVLSSRPPSAPNSDSEPTSRGGSRPSSNRPSRRGSRASSPERRHDPNAASPAAGPNETYVHSSNASRNLHGVFNASMKPFTALAHPHWPRSSSHPSISTISSTAISASVTVEPQARRPTMARHDTSPVVLQRAYSEVPDYGVATRGFIGGVPPLSSMHGLPSYEEAERSQSMPSTSVLRST